MPIVLRKLEDRHLIELDGAGKNVLLSTIQFPKDLHYLANRLPKANYTPMRTRVLDRKHFIQTITGRNVERNVSFDLGADRGSESFDHYEHRRKTELEKLRREEKNPSPLYYARKDYLMRVYAQKEMEKPRLLAPLEGNHDKFSIDIEGEINKLKKELEARRLKDEEDRKALSKVIKEKEQKEREDAKRRKEPEIYFYRNHDLPYYQYYAGKPRGYSEKSKSNIITEESDITFRKPEDERIVAAKRLLANRDNYEADISQPYIAKPTRRFAEEKPLSKTPPRGRIGLHVLARNVEERADDDFRVPELIDVPKKRIRKVSPVGMNEDRVKLPALTKATPDLIPLSVGKQKLKEISRAYRVDLKLEEYPRVSFSPEHQEILSKSGIR